MIVVQDIAPPDSQASLLLRLLPAAVRPFALLARIDRPIGWWLLFWPCSWGVLLAGGLASHWPLIAWMLLGSIAMRGAGCVYNDIVDRDLDAQVERTRSRPMPSGAVSVRAA
jgi:4-hydroxybenzoate polyprenyltransferase